MDVKTQRRAVIEKIIYDCYLPEVKKGVDAVVEQVGKNVLIQKEYFDFVGQNIYAPVVPRLDLSTPSKKLVETILAYLEMENEQAKN